MDNNKQLCLASTLVLAFLIYIFFFQPTKTESYSDYHVDYPKDFFPQIFPGRQNKFLHKIPYDDTLSTRHFRKRYYNRITPECKLRKSCPETDASNKHLESPGFAISNAADPPAPNNPAQQYFKTHLNYHEDPNLLKHESLGYSIEGIPYADYKFHSPNSQKPQTLNSYLSNRIPDLKEPEYPNDYPEWFEYTPQKTAKYYGFPYGGKVHN